MTSPSTRTNRRDAPDYTKKSFQLMLSLLKNTGSNPQRSPTRQSVLHSDCPLPGCRANSNSPLQVDTRTARFACRACGADGTPTAFVARLWQISASHAHALIDHYELERLLEGRQPMTSAMLQTRVDSYPLGVAIRHYKSQLDRHYTPLQWLTKLAITPDQARAAHIGYSSGDGLTESLTAAGLTDDDIRRSQLFVPATGHERLTGNIILADTDHTGAATWLISTDPGRDTAIPGYRLRSALPPIYAMPFRARSAIIGLHHANRPSLPLIITDDIRTYLAAAVSEGVQALLLIQRTRAEPPEQRELRLDYTANNITSRARMSAVVIAAHDPTLAIGLHARLASSHPDTPLMAAGKSLALQLASPASRSFDSLVNPATFQARAERALTQLRHALPGANQQTQATATADAPEPTADAESNDEEPQP